MPLQDILKGIKDKAESASAEILAAAEAKAAEIVESAVSEASSVGSGILAEARQRASVLEFIAKSRVDSEVRRMVLSEKQALVSSVFNRALEALQAMDAAEYRDLVMRMVVKAAHGGDEVVFGREDKDRLGAGFNEALNQAFAAAGQKGILTVSFSDESLGGGAILKRTGIVNNLTFPAVLRRVRDEAEIEVASILFAAK